MLMPTGDLNVQVMFKQTPFALVEHKLIPIAMLGNFSYFLFEVKYGGGIGSWCLIATSKQLVA